MSGPIPTDAEKHILSDFLRSLPGPQSKLIPNLRLPDVQVFVCPSCGAETPPPPHGHMSGCMHCPLCWVVYGNSIMLWKRSR